MIHALKKSSIGISTILPTIARDVLVDAAKTKDLKKINAAIRQVKDNFPSYFVQENYF